MIACSVAARHCHREDVFQIFVKTIKVHIKVTIKFIHAVSVINLSEDSFDKQWDKICAFEEKSVN